MEISFLLKFDRWENVQSRIVHNLKSEKHKENALDILKKLLSMLK